MQIVFHPTQQAESFQINISNLFGAWNDMENVQWIFFHTRPTRAEREICVC